jgi:hypothetical protein
VRSSTFEVLYNVIKKIQGTTQKWRGCLDPKVKNIHNFEHYNLNIIAWSRAILEEIHATHLVLEYDAFFVNSDVHFCFH